MESSLEKSRDLRANVKSHTDSLEVFGRYSRAVVDDFDGRGAVIAQVDLD